MFIDHLAVVTADLTRQSEALPDFCRKQAIETFPAEGTQEQYVEFSEQTPRLLLLQPIAAGPYARALAKRGPGLHHIGARTPSIDALVPRLSELGLLMHPISIQTLKQGVAWLCKPGLPFLIELSEGKADSDFEILELGFPTGSQLPVFAEQLFSNARLYSAATDCFELSAGDKQMKLSRL